MTRHRRGLGLRRDDQRGTLTGYALGLCAWAVAALVRLVLADWFPPGFPYLTFFPAVVVVAYFAGLRLAVLTAVLSGLTAWWFWIGPVGFDWSLATALALVFYVFVVAVDVFFIVATREARARLEQEARRSAALAHSRDLLMQEVQHRVSNNIQVVAALLGLEAAATSDPAARRALSEAAARTGLIATVQRGLLDAHGQAAPFTDLARGLIDDALRAAGRPDVLVRIAPSDVTLGPEEATPVMLTLLECVNNALEHALPDRAGTVDVSLEGEHRRTLTVRDDGAGPPAGFDAARSRSLGFRILHGMAAQLGGRFELTPAAPGAQARLTWPRPESVDHAIR